MYVSWLYEYIDRIYCLLPQTIIQLSIGST